MRFLLGAALLALLLIPSASAGREYWGCFDRQPDGQCVVTVSVANNFPTEDQQMIREVLGNFSESPNIEAVEAQGGNGNVRIVLGRDGFWTDMGTRRVEIDRKWTYGGALFDPASWPGMRGVYCHELMHAIAGTIDGTPRLLPSCFNGTSGYLGPEDLAEIASTYPLP